MKFGRFQEAELNVIVEILDNNFFFRFFYPRTSNHIVPTRTECGRRQYIERNRIPCVLRQKQDIGVVWNFIDYIMECSF